MGSSRWGPSTGILSPSMDIRLSMLKPPLFGSFSGDDVKKSFYGKFCLEKFVILESLVEH